jgi:hypothetical protein
LAGLCYGLSFHSIHISPSDYVLVAFNFLRRVGSNVSALNAAPRIATQKSGFTLRLVAMDRLSRATVLTRYDEIPPEGFTHS